MVHTNAITNLLAVWLFVLLLPLLLSEHGEVGSYYSLILIVIVANLILGHNKNRLLEVQQFDI